MADLNKIIEDLSRLTVVEAADLSKQLEEKWGVTAAAAVAAAPAAPSCATPVPPTSAWDEVAKGHGVLGSWSGPHPRRGSWSRRGCAPSKHTRVG